MTLPKERTNAVLNAKDFLYDLMDPKKTPKIPMWIRVRARSVLKHFPSNTDMRHAADGSPERFGHVEEEGSAFFSSFLEENMYHPNNSVDEQLLSMVRDGTEKPFKKSRKKKARNKK